MMVLKANQVVRDPRGHLVLRGSLELVDQLDPTDRMAETAILENLEHRDFL